MGKKKRRITNREARALVEEMEAQGWTWEWSGGDHIKLWTPNGLACASVAGSPSCPRSIKNCRSDLKRALRLSLEREEKRAQRRTEIGEEE